MQNYYGITPQGLGLAVASGAGFGMSYFLADEAMRVPRIRFVGLLMASALRGSLLMTSCYLFVPSGVREDWLR